LTIFHFHKQTNKKSIFFQKKSFSLEERFQQQISLERNFLV